MRPLVLCVSLVCWSCGPESDAVDSATTERPSVTVFRGATLWAGTRQSVIEDGALVVADGRVVAVGAADQLDLPADAETVDLTGRWLIPGYVNTHGHVGGVRGLEGGHYNEDNLRRQLELYANYGVTTVVSLGGDDVEGIALRNAQDDPDLDRARLFVAGPVVEAETPEAARDVVGQVARMGVDFIKIRVDDNLGTTKKMSPEVYTAVIDEAHARDLKVAAHLFYLEDARSLLEVGADFIAHSIRDRLIDARFIAQMAELPVCYTPTLMREVSAFVYESRPEFFDDPFFIEYADTTAVRQLSDPDRQAEVAASRSARLYKEAFEQAKVNLRVLAGAGLPVALGTDTGPAGRFQGYFEHLELALMVDAGMSTDAALLAATGRAAACLELEDVGSLLPGKWADFQVLTANPFQDIGNTRAIESVWVAGNRVR